MGRVVERGLNFIFPSTLRMKNRKLVNILLATMLRKIIKNETNLKIELTLLNQNKYLFIF